MKTIELKLYSFSELSDEAKQNAIENYRSKGYEPNWTQENTDTVKAFYNVFPIEQYGRDWTNFRINANHDEINDFSGIRLAKYIWNNYKDQLFKGKYYSGFNGVQDKPIRHKRLKVNEIKTGSNKGKFGHYYHSAITLDNSCVLTGYSIDDDILQPVYEFLEKPDNTTFEELIQDCLNAWQKAVESDEEYQNSDEYIAEYFEANNYEFIEDGEIF
jgi:hypothetical protein